MPGTLKYWKIVSNILSVSHKENSITGAPLRWKKIMDRST